jgi:hypothetical protein
VTYGKLGVEGIVAALNPLKIEEVGEMPYYPEYKARFFPNTASQKRRVVLFSGP